MNKLKKLYLKNTKNFRKYFNAKTERFLKQKKLSTPASTRYFFFLERYAEKILPVLTSSKKYSAVEMLLKIVKIMDYPYNTKKELLFYFKPSIKEIKAFHRMLLPAFSYQLLFRFYMLLVKSKFMFLRFKSYES
jgi:hypothetical protein